ncbi:hypothetical protein DRH27_04060 [Candidatus Falkowbacteria bacterium]|nr:MAG: hypothetical protein DRH27_04060 [Candidatus Falkowbacteria bacterium]
MQKKQENSDFGIGNNQFQNTGALNKSQKIAVISLAFFAFLILILWSVQFKKTITGSVGFVEEDKNASMDNSVVPIAENNLSLKDTDEDGINDSDELNIYLTSPYLEDSDSDGFLDREEIESGNDPNCPQGVDCYGVESLYSSEGEIKKDTSLNAEDILLEQLEFTENLSTDTAGNSQSQDQELVNFLNGQLDAQSLRDLLIESGIDKDMLNQISDEDLIKSYQQMLIDSLDQQ